MITVFVFCSQLKSKIMNEQHLSNLLFALGSMGLTWESLSKALKVSLMAGLYRVNFDRDSFPVKASGNSNQNTSSMHSGYSRKWVSKKKAGADEFNVLFSRNGLVLKDEVPSDIFFSMPVPKGAKSDIRDMMNSQGFSMSIVGLCKLGEEVHVIPYCGIDTLDIFMMDTQAPCGLPCQSTLQRSSKIRSYVWLQR